MGMTSISPTVLLAAGIWMDYFYTEKYKLEYISTAGYIQF